MAHETVTKGRHAELVALAALLANGWTVMEPTAPDAFDLGITRPGWTEFKRVQVKSARLRNKDGADWIVVTGAKNNGQPYSIEEADYFIGVYDGVAYMFPNRLITEYWVKPAELSAKWTRLDASIANLNNDVEAV
jgi:hypothetical protein